MLFILVCLLMVLMQIPTKGLVTVLIYNDIYTVAGGVPIIKQLIVSIYTINFMCCLLTSNNVHTFFVEVRSMEKQLMSVEKLSFFMGSHFWSWPGMSCKEKPHFISLFMSV